MKSIRIHTRTLLVSAVLALPAAQAADTPPAPRLKLGAYYFAGWSGKSPYDDGSVSNAWAKGMPTHFTKKLGTEFAGRTPVWGWREDTPGVLERQIDLAADHGLAFFAYCWYFKDSKGQGARSGDDLSVQAAGRLERLRVGQHEPSGHALHPGGHPRLGSPALGGDKR